MNKNLQSPTTLTEFAPLSPEPEDNPGLTYLFSKFFKRGCGNQSPGASSENKPPSVVVSSEAVITSEIPSPPDTRWPDNPEFNKEPHSDTSSLTTVGVVDLEEGRSLPNVLKRISNLLALKSSGLQSYKDTELKQYWMPDSVSKECYDCGEKFTTFRRKHHCRVCGQIFCSRCCNQEIPGKIMGCTGDLRVCTYCGKVVLSYLQSADMGADLSSDLRALQQDLQTKFGAVDTPLFPSLTSNHTNLSAQNSERDDQVKRKPSVGYQEEKFIQARCDLNRTQEQQLFDLFKPIERSFDQATLHQHPKLRQVHRSHTLRQYSSDEQSSPLHNLVNELSHPSSGLTARLGYGVFTASQLVDWLMLQNRASLRSQGVAIGQALLETGYIESIGLETSDFSDNATMFRLREPRSPSRTPPPPPSSDELWPHEAPHDCTTTGGGTVFLLLTDSESECPASEMNIPSSASLFRLDLNLEESTVHISRPPPPRRPKTSISASGDRDPVDTAGMVVKAMAQSYREGSREPVNWYNTSANSLRTDNAERQAYLTLHGGFQQHLAVLVKQLLNSEGLAQSWSETVLPIAHTVVDTVRPDLRNDSDDMDIRQYVQLKKVSGGSRSDSCIVGGVVCRKNLAHRAMPTRLANPRILLLSCAIVYQRVEGRFMSLEPVMMQEQEYLRHTVARIAAMAPDLVLVQRNVSRLAQESLLRLGISLVLNVKSSVLERVARMTGADIVKSIDAQVCRPQLGKCANFYVKTFTSETGVTKTLMFLEGCSSPHLGCTVLLRGAPTNELAKLKRVTSWLIYTLYNWRLELSFLMDEFACPPSINDDNFFHDNSNSSPSEENKLVTPSPIKEKDFLSEFTTQKKLESESYQRNTNNDKVNPNKENEDMSNKITNDLKTKGDLYKIGRLSVKDKSLSEERRINVESVSDFSDPLHSYLNLEDEVFNETNNGQSLAVIEPLQANRFRKALDDTLLSVSPFVKFSVPYLETESGRNCLLRRYFPATVYWTAQLEDKPTAPGRPPVTDLSNKDAYLKLNGVKLHPVHPFVTAKLTEPVNSDEVQTLLALYRAQGGRLPLAPHTKVPAAPPGPVSQPPPPLDSLDPSKHQRLAVLFCSYSHESPNAPAFCVNPWVVHMDYYGRNDIPLGAFLERYCFRSTYVCPSDRCDTSMMKHVRRFVHDGGAVQISLREIEGAPHTDDDSILMWSYCQACNQQVTQVMRMSNDTWAFSFAKYLELHFHAGLYTPRGGDCTHSLHQACKQFFGHKNMVAYFQYDKISVWEISLPPLLLVMQTVSHVVHQDAILEEVKRWALNGYEVFSAILNRLCTLASNGEAGAMVMKQQLQKEQAIFKSRVEEIQLRLTSPTHSSGPEKSPSLPNLWHLEDSLVLLKRSIAEAVCDWNIRLSEAEAAYQLRRREEKSKKSVQEKASVSSGLGEIIDGVATSQILDVQSSESPRLGRRPLGSQLSQSSLHSATDVMDIDDSQDTLAEDSIFIGDFDNNETVDNKDNRPSSIQINPISGEMLPVVESKLSPLGDLASELEEVHERRPYDHLADEDVDISPGPGSSSKESHSKQLLTDRVSMKQILSQLLPKDTPTNPLQCPMSPQEHYTLPTGVFVPVVVYEREPSSIIAYALSCHDYRSGLDDIRAKRLSASEQPSPSPLLKRKSGSLESKEVSCDTSSAGDSRKPGVLSFLRTTSSSGNLNQGLGGGGGSAGGGEGPVEGDEGKPETEPVKPRSSKDKPSSHLEVQFSDSTANFIVKVYYADEFARLRATIFPAGEEAFVRSLSRCIQWAARGGKSGSNFAKTKDDRFILKEMSRTETHPFMESAPQYFDYIDRCVRSGSPTLLGKIVGVYRIMYRSSTSNATFRSNLLVMENLFYGRQVKHKFDLKGSVRNRLVNPMEQGGEIVLLDENLINMTCDSPLYILPHSKTVLMQAIQSDTQFLAGQSVMDYSLLVGLDEANKELVVGIIDYIRTFTWDKRLETMVKKSGLLGGQGKLPTIVSPDEYRDRFIAAMHRYFLPVPDQWTGLGKGLDF